MSIIATIRTARIADPDEFDLPWHRWFAWYPVRVNNKRVWLKRIQRYGKFNPFAGYARESGWGWQSTYFFEYKE